VQQRERRKRHHPDSGSPAACPPCSVCHLTGCCHGMPPACAALQGFLCLTYAVSCAALQLGSTWPDLEAPGSSSSRVSCSRCHAALGTLPLLCGPELLALSVAKVCHQLRLLFVSAAAAPHHIHVKGRVRAACPVGGRSGGEGAARPAAAQPGRNCGPEPAGYVHPLQQPRTEP
jgi:hypothetical protein